MTDDPKNPETGAEQSSAGLPIPKLEPASPDGPPSSVDINAIAKQVADQLRNELRMAQSTKDKELDKIKKKLGIGDLAELEQMGATIPDNVKLEYRLQQIEGARQSPSPSQPSSSPGNGEALTAQDVQTVIKKYALDANDAEVLEKLSGKTYKSREHFELTMADVALARSTRQPPSPAASTSLTASNSTGKMTEQVADGKYAELRQLFKQPTVNAAKIKALTKELNENGYLV